MTNLIFKRGIENEIPTVSIDCYFEEEQNNWFASIRLNDEDEPIIEFNHGLNFHLTVAEFNELSELFNQEGLKEALLEMEKKMK